MRCVRATSFFNIWIDAPIRLFERNQCHDLRPLSFTLHYFCVKIACSLQSTTLRDLKVSISRSITLGMIPMNQQRIFHFGRELKTLGRTLDALGVGRLLKDKKTNATIVIHVHAVPSSIMSTTNDQSTASVPIAVTTISATNHQRQRSIRSQRPTNVSTNSVDLCATASTTPFVGTVATNKSNIHNTSTNGVQTSEVVNLFSDEDNNDDDDDDDDCIVVEDKPTTARSTSTAAAARDKPNKRPRH
jgi:hypothetical protein